jgi:hypothetical protein
VAGMMGCMSFHVVAYASGEEQRTKPVKCSISDASILEDMEMVEDDSKNPAATTNEESEKAEPKKVKVEDATDRQLLEALLHRVSEVEQQNKLLLMTLLSLLEAQKQSQEYRPKPIPDAVQNSGMYG